jgi:multidrug efflux pump
MNVSALFIRRPVATTLLTLGIALAGILAFFRLPVAPLPQVDLPAIMVSAVLPGASPETVAATVAAPLERHLGQIADVTEMTSQSSLGATRIVMLFDLSRDIDGAARDVQAAINAARADLPTSLRSNPTYHKLNPASAPILILALTSPTLTRVQLYDAAVNVLQQRLSQIYGIGQVVLGGGALPAVRVELNPHALFNYGIGLEDIRAALGSANANAPKGAIEGDGKRLQIYTNDQAMHAVDYRPLVVAWRNGAAVRLSDVANVIDGAEDVRTEGLYNGKPAVLAVLFAQPGANIIQTIDAVKAQLPYLKAALPEDVSLAVMGDRSTTIRASLADTERTLLISVCLVIGVVFLFLRDWRATLIPAVAVPVSILGTFGAMYLIGYSLDNLSLMALTIATGFVVDDAIVVLENIARYLEQGVPRMQAALRGAREVSFTVVSMSLSLIAVFLPILLMGGIAGRLFQEFAVTLSLAILISLVISLTTTPMLCALLLRRTGGAEPLRLFARITRGYGQSLTRVLRHGVIMMLILGGTVALNVALYDFVPKGFFPQQDTGRIMGRLTADQSISFRAMRTKLDEMVRIVSVDKAVDAVVGFTGGGGGGPGSSQSNNATVYISLKPLSERRADATQVIARLRGALSHVAGATLFMFPAGDIPGGGRQTSSQYQYTLRADSGDELQEWTPKLVAALQRDKRVIDVTSDQQQAGLQTNLTIDRDAASRLGISPLQIDNTLYDAFGQRQVSVIYSDRNQYHVVMEIDPRYTQDPAMLSQIWVSTTGGPASGTQQTNALAGNVAGKGTTTTNSAAQATADSVRNAATNAIGAVGKAVSSSASAVSTAKETMVPLAAVTQTAAGSTPLSISHDGAFVATTISFNLPTGGALSDAEGAIADASQEIGLPPGIHGGFGGTAKLFQSSASGTPVLILAALLAVYIVLGVLYESYVHPVTILSTLPSAGVGALLALLAFRTEFSVIALIGIILLIGIVKKNAIMMIDFALAAERTDGLAPREAILEASLLRFRPIMMTTMTAMLGALPLALSFGEGGEIRRPLGISIVGGLLISQVLTLYTTPVVFLYLDRFGRFVKRRWRRILPGPKGSPEAAE